MYIADLHKGEKESNQIQKRTISPTSLYFVSHASNSVVRGLMTSNNSINIPFVQ